MVETDPQNPEAYLWLGVAYAINKEYEKAGENFLKATDMDPAFLDTTRLKRTFSIGGTALFTPKAVITTLQNAASLRSRAGDYEASLNFINLALKLAPSTSQLYVLKAGIYMKMNKGEEAFRTLEEGRKLGVLDNNALYFLGNMYMERNQLDTAIHVFKDVIAKFPDFAKGYFGLGIAYFKKESLDSARVYLRKALSLDPDNKDAWYNLGVVELKQKDYDGAIESLKRYVDMSPGDENAWFLLAASLYEVDRLKEALDAINRALQLNPNRVDSWSYKGSILKKMGKTEEALKAFQKATELEKKGGGG